MTFATLESLNGVDRALDQIRIKVRKRRHQTTHNP